MTADPRRLKLVDLCRLLNSTPLGEVIQEHQLKAHRNRAGLRIGDHRRIDLVKYVAWLVLERHKAKAAAKNGVAHDDTSLIASAECAAALVVQSPTGKGLSAQQEAALAALLSSPNISEAAIRIGVRRGTLHRWLNEPKFRAAFHQVRREMLGAAVTKVQAAVGQAVDVLVNVARSGRRDSDRVRAAVALLEHAYRGLESAEMLYGDRTPSKAERFVPGDAVKLLAGRLKALDESQLPAAEKARLMGALADSLLRAYSVDVLDKRLEALHTVLVARKEKKPA